MALVIVGLAIVAVCLVAIVVGIGRARRVLIFGAYTDRLARTRQLIALDLLDRPTHGRLSSAGEVLTASRDRLQAIGPADAPELKSVLGALAVVEGLEESIRDTAHVRQATPREALNALGGLAAENDYHPPGDPMRLYQDPLNLPDRIRGARTRDFLTRIGAVLDDVRLLHDARIESAVLMFTMWARLVLVALAPLLAPVSFGRVPLMHGLGPRDVPWLLALGCCAWTAALAPWVARSAMRRDTVGARLRRTFVVVEGPIAIAAIIATPCWPVVAFSAGWLNWWQRTGVDVRRGVIWLAVVSASLGIGLALIHAGVGKVAAELGGSLLVVALIGGSYGAMLPVTLSMLLLVVVGGLVAPRRARRIADEQLSLAIGQLLDAALVIEQTAPAGDEHAAGDALNLREIAGALAAGADRSDRWARRAPLGLEMLLDGALEKARGPRAGSPMASFLSAQASQSGTTEPLTVLPASFYEDRLATLRFRRRAHAQVLSLLMVEIVAEARRYGTGPLSTRCHCADGRLVLRFANPIRDDPVPAGRSSGAGRLRKLVDQIPEASVDQRGIVDGTFVDLPRQARRFGVQISLPLSLFVCAGESTLAAS